MKKLFITVLILPISLASIAIYGVNAQEEAAPELTEKQQAELDKALEGRTAGPAKSCIQRTEQRHFTVISDDIFIYSASRNNGTIYVNKPPRGCFGAEKHILVYERPDFPLCHGEIITVLDRYANTFVSSCTFGKFIPYTKDKT